MERASIFSQSSLIVGSLAQIQPEGNWAGKLNRLARSQYSGITGATAEPVRFYMIHDGSDGYGKSDATGKV